MKTTTRTDSVYFSTKGQVVIPRWLRREFEIEEGMRALVYPEDDNIVLKPITAKYIRKLRGSLKDLPLLETLKEDKKREREL